MAAKSENREKEASIDEMQQGAASLSHEQPGADAPDRGEGQNAEDASLSIEERFARVDALLNRMEDEATPLEESFRMYQEGMQLLQAANSSIDAIEKELRILVGEDEEDGEDGI